LSQQVAQRALLVGLNVDVIFDLISEERKPEARVSTLLFPFTEKNRVPLSSHVIDPYRVIMFVKLHEPARVLQ
jgi:hypothetical protein